MEFVLDVHNHTISSGHAYSTIMEIAKEASNKGLKLIGITDHGPKMPGGPHIYHIANMRVLPEEMYGVEILKGVEANIMDKNGALDVPEKILKSLDIILAGFHTPCYETGSREENTETIINVMKNNYVDVIVHPGNPQFEIDLEKFVQTAKETGVLIEINNSSFRKSRRGSKDNCIKIAKLCKEYNVPIIVGSDSHFAPDVGRFDVVERVLEDIDMPEELVINTSVEKLKEYLKARRAKRMLNN
ncbi:phosphatase [Clostridiaceae bacterium M8S5]|nr:phosphatase [Clostridiaceae bacterium M8S5]